jgi:chemotaxis protein MotB
MAADGGAASKAQDGHVAPVIIKKVKKSAHEAHHGGAWKVAYADFVTAMMAFFLLLWLLNATTEEQKLGISNYFAPESVTYTKSGAGGVLGGQSLTKKGALKSPSSPAGVVVPLPRPKPEDSKAERDALKSGAGPSSKDKVGGAGTGKNEGGPAAGTGSGGPAAGAKTGGPSGGAKEGGPAPGTGVSRAAEKAALEAAAKREQQTFKGIETDIRKAIEASPELKGFTKNLQIATTPEGLRIQLVDQTHVAMFPRGSAVMPEKTQKLLRQIAKIITKVDNKIAIAGHTDSTKYSNPAGYSNWELSADRANASRRALMAFGVPVERISEVVGKADREPMIANNPKDPRNRRISITLLRKFKPATAAKAPAKPSMTAGGPR